MRGVNKVILIGNLGKDPEVRHLEGQMTVANFTLATNRRFKTKNGEMKDETEWHRIVVWGKLAEIVEQYIKKGSAVYIEGSLQTRKWQDKDGHDRYTTEIRANEIQMLDRKGSETSDGSHETHAASEGTDIASGPADDLPF